MDIKIDYSLIFVTFFLDNNVHFYTYWYAVPRVGDEIMVRDKKNPKADKHGKVPFRVVRVVWGVESQEEELDRRQAVNIEIERI